MSSTVRQRNRSYNDRGSVTSAECGDNVTADQGAGKLTPDLVALVNKLRTAVTVKDRSYRLQKYKRCFVAEELVKWLCEEGYVQDANEAVAIGNTLLDAGLFAHVVDPDHVFENRYLFFRWTDDSQPTVDARIDAQRKGVQVSAESPTISGSIWQSPALQWQLPEETEDRLMSTKRDNQDLEALVDGLRAELADQRWILLALVCMFFGPFGKLVGLALLATAVIWSPTRLGFVKGPTKEVQALGTDFADDDKQPQPLDQDRLAMFSHVLTRSKAQKFYFVNFFRHVCSVFLFFCWL